MWSRGRVVAALDLESRFAVAAGGSRRGGGRGQYVASSLRDGGLPATQWPPNDGGLWRREVPWWLGGVSSVLPSNFARRPRPKSRTGRVNWRRRHALDAAVPGRGKCVAPEKRPQRWAGPAADPDTVSCQQRGPQTTREVLSGRRWKHAVHAVRLNHLRPLGAALARRGDARNLGLSAALRTRVWSSEATFLRIDSFSPQKRYL